jgi:hypothetical protein
MKVRGAPVRVTAVVEWATVGTMLLMRPEAA